MPPSRGDAESDRLAVRQARAHDVDAILNLLTHYDQPREFFEPWYEHDPSYRPEHSWLVEEHGHLLAHLRIYPRRLRIAGGIVPVAGIGNVVTDRDARGRGHADRLLSRAIKDASAGGYAYSLLWTHVPQLYRRHGYGSVREHELHAIAQPASSDSVVRPAEGADLPAVARLQDRFDATRSGPGVRDLDYWRGSRRWLGDEMLVAERAGTVVGYARFRHQGDLTDVLELGVDRAEPAVGRALIAAAAGPGRTFRAVLPPSLWPVVDEWRPTVVEKAGLMGRPLSLRALASTLRGTWSSRVLRELDAGQLTALLLRGCDAATRALLGDRPDLDELVAIAPAQDFVLWPTDAF